MILGICGLAGSGKSEVAKALEKKHSFVAVAFADPLKRILMETFDFTEEQLWGPSEERSKPDKHYPRPTHEFGDGEQVCRVCGMVIHDTELVGGIKRLKTCYLTPRYALQTLGTGWGRDCYPAVWVDYAIRVTKQLLEHKHLWYTRTEGLVDRVEQCPQGEFERDGIYAVEGVVITDVRYRNEFDAIKKAGGKVAWIRRGKAEPKWNHSSETEMLTIPDDAFDYYLVNEGDMDHLGLMVDRMMDVFNGRIIPFDDAQKDVPPFKRHP